MPCPWFSQQSAFTASITAACKRWTVRGVRGSRLRLFKTSSLGVSLFWSDCRKAGAGANLFKRRTWAAQSDNSNRQGGVHTKVHKRLSLLQQADGAHELCGGVVGALNRLEAIGRVGHLCGKQAGSGLGQLALRRTLSAPDRAPGCPKPRSASANQPPGPLSLGPAI